MPGVRVGHATVAGSDSGCTVVLGPFRGAAWVPGMATGSRELHVLEVEHIVPAVDAVLLTGGSAFGLAAADGVTGWLAEHDAGYDTGEARVPIVPGAVIFDLREGRARPGPGTGRAACAAASDQPVPVGRVGAGRGATVGNIAGRAGEMAGGVGSFALTVGPWTLGALAVVNALGDVLDGDGHIVAGARSPEGAFLDTSHVLRDRLPSTSGGSAHLRAGRNTTLAVVATDAPLSRVDLRRLARMAWTALPRRISPVGTPFDGDVVFALGTSLSVQDVPSPDLLGLGTAARDALEESITGAVVDQPSSSVEG